MGSFLVADDERAGHRAAYRYERAYVANAANAYLVTLLDAGNEVRRTAARDELLCRGEHGLGGT